jgi:hypothetical protein
VNGGGWGCIYSLQPLSSRCSNPVDRGRSAPLVRTVRPCTSTTSGFSSFSTTERSVPEAGRSVTLVWTVRPYISTTSGFSSFSTPERFVPEAGQSTLGLGRCSLLHRTVRCVDLCFCSVPVRGSPWCRGRSDARARTVRA